MKMLFLYKEFGIENGKSIMDDFSENAHPEKDRIINYLKNGRGTVAAPGYYTDVVTGKTVHITKAILTDDEYSWPSVFPYYVEKYNLKLPDIFVSKILNEHSKEPYKPRRINKKNNSCNVRITDDKGLEYTGRIITVNTVNDENPDDDVLLIQTKEGKLYGFKKSTVVQIDYID